MKENKFLEFKSEITNTFLKTVSAFANFNDGEIVFGITEMFAVLQIRCRAVWTSKIELMTAFLRNRTLRCRSQRMKPYT